jgi:cytosine/uracil/thiamine/allantoin permease
MRYLLAYLFFTCIASMFLGIIVSDSGMHPETIANLHALGWMISVALGGSFFRAVAWSTTPDDDVNDLPPA